MSDFNFADQYKLAGLSPTSENIASREAAVDSIRNSLDFNKSLDLVRFYFDLPVESSDWFVEAFRENDTSFSLVHNQAEAQLLSALILRGAMDDGNSYALLAVLSGSAGGNRSSETASWLLSDAKEQWGIRATRNTGSKGVDTAKIKAPAATKIADEIAAVAANDWPNLLAVIEKVRGESTSGVKTLTNQVLAVVKPMNTDMRYLREENAILWWLMGETSRISGSHYSEYDVGSCCILCGLDMGDLSTVSPLGPVAAPAMLGRIIELAKKAEKDDETLSGYVDAFPNELLEKLPLHLDGLDQPDIFPVMTALAKARDNGVGSWQTAFKKVAHVDANISFTPQSLAVQIYQESLLGQLI